MASYNKCIKAWNGIGALDWNSPIPQLVEFVHACQFVCVHGSKVKYARETKIYNMAKISIIVLRCKTVNDIGGNACNRT